MSADLLHAVPVPCPLFHLDSFVYNSCVFGDATIEDSSEYLLATDLCPSWPKVLNLVTVRGFMKTPLFLRIVGKILTLFFHDENNKIRLNTTR